MDQRTEEEEGTWTRGGNKFLAERYRAELGLWTKEKFTLKLAIFNSGERNTN